MNTAQYISDAAGVVFLLLPLLLLLVVNRQHKLLSIWAECLLIGLLGWLLLVLYTHYANEALWWQIQNQPDPDDALLDRWAADGASKTMIALFGWLISLIYALPYFALRKLWHRWQQPVN